MGVGDVGLLDVLGNRNVVRGCHERFLIHDEGDRIGLTVNVWVTGDFGGVPNDDSGAGDGTARGGILYDSGQGAAPKRGREDRDLGGAKASTARWNMEADATSGDRRIKTHHTMGAL